MLLVPCGRHGTVGMGHAPGWEMCMFPGTTLRVCVLAELYSASVFVGMGRGIPFQGSSHTASPYFTFRTGG